MQNVEMKKILMPFNKIHYSVKVVAWCCVYAWKFTGTRISKFVWNLYAARHALMQKGSILAVFIKYGFCHHFAVISNEVLSRQVRSSCMDTNGTIPSTVLQQTIPLLSHAPHFPPNCTPYIINLSGISRILSSFSKVRCEGKL